MLGEIVESSEYGEGDVNREDNPNLLRQSLTRIPTPVSIVNKATSRMRNSSLVKTVAPQVSIKKQCF